MLSKHADFLPSNT